MIKLHFARTPFLQDVFSNNLDIPLYVEKFLAYKDEFINIASLFVVK